MTREFATYYRNCGLSVIPLRPRDKRPALASWKEYQERLPTDAEIEEWWSPGTDRGIGIVCGGVSGMVALDFDAHLTARSFLDLHPEFEDGTIRVVTARGQHVWVQVRERVATLRIEEIGLDIKAEGSYVVAPPSIHPTGQPYEFANEADVLIGIENFHGWLRGILASLGVEWQPPSDDGQRQRLDVDAVLVDLDEGNRNESFAKVVGKLHHAGLSAEDILSLLRPHADRCAFPQDELEAEVRGICGRYSPPRAGNRTERFPRTDAGNAELFARLHGDRLRFDHRRRRWLLWAEHWWEPDRDAEVRRLAKETARHRYVAAASIQDRDEWEKEAKWAIASESRQRLDAALYLGQAEHPMADAGDKWDTDPWLLGVANGVIDLRTGELRDGCPDDWISMRSPVRYDPDAECPLWLAFLDRIMDGNQALINFIQRKAGNSLTGDVSEQDIILAHGIGANGKSTLLTAIRETLGDYACQAAPGLLLRKRGETHPTELADLAGKRFVASVEVEEGRRLAEALVKWLTGGDQMKARFMRRDFFEFTPTYKIWLAANHKPTIAGTDLAIWRRIRLIPFSVVIPDEEQDKELTIKLRREYPGILNWALQGCLDWQREGIDPPAEVRAATDAYKAEQDVLALFIDECCKEGPKERVAPDALYVGYTNWCKEAGEKPLSRNAFGTRLTERGIPTSRDHEGRWRDGLGLKMGAER